MTAWIVGLCFFSTIHPPSWEPLVHGRLPNSFDANMKTLNNGFYKSKAWEKCRASYIKSKGGLCERCLSLGIYTAGKIVHHKKELTPENYTDPSIAFNFDNLMLVCHSCHEQIHKGMKRYGFDAEGNLHER